MIKSLIVSLIILLPLITIGQSSNDSIQISIKPYASLSGNLAVYDKEMDLQDNVSKLGLKASIKKGKVTFLAASELRLNLVQGGASFNIDNSPIAGFLDVQTVAGAQTISNRIGYLGFDFEKYGTITFGKQWSVYYDVTSYTNKFEVFGGTASATYIGGTDGGENGTGRANQAIIYRNQFGPFLFGAQTQVRGGNNNKFVDGFGFSGQLEITKQILFGAAFNRSLLSDNLINQGQIIGLSGQPSYYALGINYMGEKLTLSAVAAIEQNGDFTQGSYLDANNNLVNPTVVFNAKGLEFYSNYIIDKFSIRAGYNLYVPQTKSLKTNTNQSPISTSFKTNDVIIGATYQPFQAVQIYAEQRLSFGKTELNKNEPSVFALGMTIDISKTFNSKSKI